MAEDIRTLIQSRVDDAREKIAELNKAEKEAQGVKKDQVGEENAPTKGRKVLGDVGFPKTASGPVESDDLRKIASELQVAQKQEDDVIKLASDLAIEAAERDAAAVRKGVAEAFGGQDKEAASVASAAPSTGRKVLEALGIVTPTPQQASRWSNNTKNLQEGLPELSESALGSVKSTIKGRVPVYTENLASLLEDGVRSLTGGGAAASQGSNVGRNLALGAGAGVAGAGAGALIGHNQGVRSEQAKDPGQIRSAYGLGWQRRGQYGKTASSNGASDWIDSKMVEQGHQEEEEKVASISDRVKDLLGAGSKRVQGALGGDLRDKALVGLGAGGIAAGGGVVGHRMGVSSEQEKDPYQIRTAFGSGAQYGSRATLQHLFSRGGAGEPKMASEEELTGPDKNIADFLESAGLNKEAAFVPKGWSRFVPSHKRVQNKPTLKTPKTQASGAAPKGTEQAAEGAEQAAEGGGWRGVADQHVPGASEFVDKNLSGVSNLIDNNRFLSGAITGTAAAASAPLLAKGAKWVGQKAGFVAKDNAPILERLGGAVRGQSLTGRNARGNAAAGLGVAGAGLGGGALLLGGRDR